MTLVARDKDVLAKAADCLAAATGRPVIGVAADNRPPGHRRGAGVCGGHPGEPLSVALNGDAVNASGGAVGTIRC